MVNDRASSVSLVNLFRLQQRPIVRGISKVRTADAKPSTGNLGDERHSIAALQPESSSLNLKRVQRSNC